LGDPSNLNWITPAEERDMFKNYPYSSRFPASREYGFLFLK
jgi:hypothetical protein